MTAITTQDVTNSLKFFIELATGLTTDDENFVTDLGGARFIIRDTTGEGKHGVLYQSNIPRGDYFIINPYSEGIGHNTPPQVFFYKIQRAALAARVKVAVTAALKLVLIEKNLITPADDDVGEVRPTTALQNLISGKTDSGKTIHDEIDLKCLTEIDAFMSTPANIDQIVDLIYQSKQMTATFRCAIIDDPNCFEHLSGLRKKSFQVLKALLMNLFQVKTPEELSEFTSKALGAASKMSSLFQVLFKLYSRFNQVLGDLGNSTWVIDLGIFRIHLDNLPEYTNNAKHIAPVATQTKKVDTTVTPALPPGYPAQPAQPWQPQPQNTTPAAPPGMMFMPQPNGPNGMRMPPILVPTGHPGYSAPMGQQPAFGFGQPAPQQPAFGYAPQQPAPNYGVPAFGFGQPQQQMQPQRPAFGFGQPQQPAQFSTFAFNPTPGAPYFGVR